MECKKCGAINPEDAAVCQSCGELLTQVEEQPQPVSKPNNYLIWAVIVSLFCCIFTGVISIIYALQVDMKWSLGDFAGAQSASRKAKMWAWISLAVGLGVLAAAVAWFVLFLTSPSFSGGG